MAKGKLFSKANQKIKSKRDEDLEDCKGSFARQTGEVVFTVFGYSAKCSFCNKMIEVSETVGRRAYYLTTHKAI